jgi:hypothetical protein
MGSTWQPARRRSRFRESGALDGETPLGLMIAAPIAAMRTALRRAWRKAILGGWSFLAGLGAFAAPGAFAQALTANGTMETASGPFSTTAAGGVTARLGPRFSVFAQGGYQYAADESGSNPYRRDSVKGDIGVRFAW